MSSGIIHFVNETGQGDDGGPSKRRLSRINSHVARFSHQRRKNNSSNNNNSTTVSKTPPLLQVDFVVEDPHPPASRSSSDSPEQIPPFSSRDNDQATHSTGVPRPEQSERRRSAGSTATGEPRSNKLIRHQSAPVPVSHVKQEEHDLLAREITKRHSDGLHLPFCSSPEIESMGAFFQLADSVDLYEKYLLNYFKGAEDFTDLQTQMFGFHKDALYCPQRVPAARSIQQSRAALHWILIIAEEQMAKRINEAPNSHILKHSILKRRASGYKMLRSLLNNADFDLETAVLALRYAISAECYMNHKDAAMEHLKALDALLSRPGALERFVANPDKTALSLATLKRMYVSVPCRIKSFSDFETIKTMVFIKWKRLQALSKQNHADLVRHACAAYLTSTNGNCQTQTMPTNHTKETPPEQILLDRYISIKKSALFSTYSCETMNAACDPNWMYTYQAGLFALFYDMNMTLASFGRDNLRDKILFLEQLKVVLDGSSANTLGGTSTLSIVDWVREQCYRECFKKDEAIVKEIDLCTYEINGFKVFALLDISQRIRLTGALRAWLLIDISVDVDMDKDDLTEEEFVSMEEQVTRAWWDEQLTPNSSPSP
ncbi:hypothetical protein AYO20_02709 [Fonsecaea nubica]|uniref:Uncharacterized protein n=1 Tax=Fonsecaea nubica TaxID=856822 RepID=A0A178D811_9EURO|nr:hypothetical protein AYO20_02709 [Fonsecaea nubica]OAL37876.1 hypothetical protein AYO20_02709 [Fonsecaea nubica]